MRNINDLQANEFPGVNKGKFEQWKELRIKGTKTVNYIVYGIIGIGGVLILTGTIRSFGAVGYFLLALLIIASSPIARKIGLAEADRLAGEIGLTEAAVIKALRK